MARYVGKRTEEEQRKIERLVRSQTAPVRRALRARMVTVSAEGETAPAIAARRAGGTDTVRHWLKGVTGEGLAGRDDAPPSGRPGTYTEEQRRRVMAQARSRPPTPAGGRCR